MILAQPRARALTAKEAGSAVKARRLEKGLTQARLAELAGVSRKFVNELEAGHARAELGKALLVFEVVGVEVVGARELAGRYAPDTDVDVRAHLQSFNPRRRLPHL